MLEPVTVVLTSCGRLDLLEQTLDSFFKWNTHPIKRFIITEDSVDPIIWESCNVLTKKYPIQIEWIFNSIKKGQSPSIDLAYEMVDTPWIFHLEDDWLFYRPGFIEESIKVLTTQPKCIQAWIRPKVDRILNPIDTKVFRLSNGAMVRKVKPVSFLIQNANSHDDLLVENYIGFSWNPGLKRKSDWELLPNGYSGFMHEHLVDQFYRENGYIVLSLSINDEDGWVKHIGWNRRAMDPTIGQK